MTPAMVNVVNEELEKLKAANFIEPSISPFSSPMVCVKKTDGALRVCIDFRMVNKDVINNVYPFHRIEDQLQAMAGAKWFTTLDLTKGYHQMKLAEESKEITAFSTPRGLFQWKVLPSGMKTSGAVFQRLVDLIVGELQPRCVVVYIDNITIFSNSLNEHLHDVDKLLAKLDGANLKVNLNKCSFCKEEVLVLGHIVSKEGISPNPKKVEAILESRRPASVTEVKSFLGVVNFYRKFIKNCSTVAEPLILLTRGNKKKGCYFWSEEQEAAFTRLKSMLAKAPVLRFPDWANLFWIECDASSVGIGAVISQLEIGDGEMIRRPISFASRALNRAERNYSVTDREGLALVWAVKTFKPYVFGMPFK